MRLSERVRNASCHCHWHTEPHGMECVGLKDGFLGQVKETGALGPQAFSPGLFVHLMGWLELEGPFSKLLVLIASGAFSLFIIPSPHSFNCTPPIPVCYSSDLYTDFSKGGWAKSIAPHTQNPWLFHSVHPGVWTFPLRKKKIPSISHVVCLL